jgi:hypothetical protein
MDDSAPRANAGDTSIGRDQVNVKDSQGAVIGPVGTLTQTFISNVRLGLFDVLGNKKPQL